MVFASPWATICHAVHYSLTTLPITAKKLHSHATRILWAKHCVPSLHTSHNILPLATVSKYENPKRPSFLCKKTWCVRSYIPPELSWQRQELPKVGVLHLVFLKIKYTIAINTLSRTAIHVTYIVWIWQETGIKQAVPWPGYCWWTFHTTSTPIMRLNSRGVRLTTHLLLGPGPRMSRAVFQITVQRTESKIACQFLM